MQDAEKMQSGMRIAIMCTGCFCLIISGCYAGFYWAMWDEAKEWNEVSDASSGLVGDYDSCGGLLTDDKSTNWETLLAFNACLYLTLSICTFLSMVGAFFAPLICCGCVGQCCGGIAALVCLIMTGVWRFSSEGEACAEVEGFKDHADEIKALFIAQCVLLCFYNCCAGATFQLAIQSGALQIAMLQKFKR